MRMESRRGKAIARCAGVGGGGDVPCARAGRRRQRGYTLIEVIIAFALLGLALSLLLGSLSGASRQVKWAGDAGRAALHAQSLLEQTGVGEELQPGQRDGSFEDGRYRWTLAIAPYADPLLPPQPLQAPGSARLLQLDLAVQWGDGGPKQRIDVHTLRLVAPAQGAGSVMGQ